MLTHARNLMGGLVLGTAVLVSSVAPASAAPDAQLGQIGLLNVGVQDVLNPGNCVALCQTAVSVPVAANLAANACGINIPVGVLAVQLAQNREFSCAVEGQQNKQYVVTRAQGRGQSNR
jgi:hypothetical protein